jgi:hypothetical protein
MTTPLTRTAEGWKPRFAATSVLLAGSPLDLTAG